MNVLKMAGFTALTAGAAHAGVMVETASQTQLLAENIEAIPPAATAGLEQLLHFLFSIVFLVL